MDYNKLETLCVDIIDCPHSTPKWLERGIRVIRNYNLNGAHFDFTKSSYVDEETYLDRTRRAKPEVNDIIISREAPMGTVAIIPEGLKCCLGQRLVLLKVDSKKVNPHYLLYTLMSQYVQKQIRKVDVTGSIVSNLNIPDLKELVIPICERGKQDKIASLLMDIDKKIEINNKVNETLQQQVSLLYNYWFTQFDFPGENGKPYKSSGGKMVWNKKLKREIPAGWASKSMINNELVSVLKPGVDEFNSKTYLATAEVNGTVILKGNVVEYATRESRANMQPRVNSVWFAKMKNSIKHLFLNKEMQTFIDSSILSTGFCGLQCTDDSFEYISSFVAHSYFETIKDTLAHGATQEAVNNDDLSGIYMVIPDEKTLSQYHEITKSIYGQISKNICENKELASLRDWLLPMLMNGQATVE